MSLHEHSTALEALLATTVVQTIAIALVWLLKSKEAFLRRYLGYIVALAVGVLLATAFLHLLPEAIAHGGNTTATWSLLGGTILLLFAVERIFAALTGGTAEPAATETLSTLQHHHGHHTTRPMNLVFGGMLHSLADGVSVATAFALDRRTGYLTAFAIMLHEIPHRLGDFALFVHLKISARRALHLAIFVGLPSLVGVAVVAVLGIGGSTATARLLPISAASFLYIATANLMPELQHECSLSKVLRQIFCVLAGAGLVALLGLLPNN